MTELQEFWRMYKAEKAVICQPTTMSTDYAQAEQYILRNPETGRAAITYQLQQQPRKTAIKVAARIKSVYRWAHETGLVATNPVANYKLPKTAQEEDVVVIPRHEEPLLFAGLERSGNRPSYASLARFMGQTALRTGEAFAVHLDDIRDGMLLVHRNWTLTHSLKNSTKTNRRRRVPLNPVAQGILERLAPGAINGFIFPYNRYSFQDFFASRVKNMVEQGVLSHHYRPYDLRHTVISRWIEAGISIPQIAQWAGNSNEVIFRHYAGVTQQYEMPVL